MTNTAAKLPPSATVTDPAPSRSEAERLGGGPGPSKPKALINVQACLDVLCTTTAGEYAVANLFEALMNFGQEISEAGNGEQAQAYTDLVTQAILYGDYERVFEQIKAHSRQRKA